MRTEKWYHNRLQQYFNCHYGEYENDSEWFVNPAINQWKCYLPDLQATILFTCDDEGVVTEEYKPLKMEVDGVYSVIKAASRGMDAIYEDYIIRLVGSYGFDMLREKKLLVTCGSINGRNLYTVN